MTPILITLAICFPLIVLVVGIYLRVHRSPSPDLVRFRVLRVLLCVVIACAGVSFVAAAFATKSGQSYSAGQLLPGVMNLLIASVTAVQMQRCRRGLGGKQ